MRKTYRRIAELTALCLVLGLLPAALTSCRKEEGRKAPITTYTDEETPAEQDPETLAREAALSMIGSGGYRSAYGIDAEPGTVVEMVGEDSGSVFWELVKKGAFQAAEDVNALHGYEGSDRVTVEYTAPDDNSVSDQVNLLDEVMGRNPQVICISLIDRETCQVQFDMAAENGVPVVVLYAGNGNVNILTSCMTDHTSAGILAAEKLCEAIGDEGEVAVFSADSRSQADTEKTEGFLREIEQNHPGVTVVRVSHEDLLREEYDELYAGDGAGAKEEPSGGGAADTAGEAAAADAPSEEAEEPSPEETEEEEPAEITAAEMVVRTLNDYPELKGYYAADTCTTDILLETLLGVKAGDEELLSCLEDDTQRNTVSIRAKYIRTAGCGFGPHTEEALANGMSCGCLLENPYGMGYAAVMAALRAASGEGNTSLVDTGMRWVGPASLEDPEVKDLLYLWHN